MGHIRQRGGTWCLTVKHKVLPRPFYRTFDSQEEAITFDEQLGAMLERGVVPQSLLDSLKVKKEVSTTSPVLTVVVLDYLKHAPCTTSEIELLTVMLTELRGYRISDITFDWVVKYIKYLKGPRKGVVGASRRKLGNLAPSSIRKRISSLARVVEWHWRKTTRPEEQLPTNPLRHLPRGYSVYNQSDVANLAGTDCTPKSDQERDRRMTDDEVKAVERWLTQNEWIIDTGQGQLNLCPDLLVFFHLALHTGMRMREIVRLRVNQIDFARGIIRVEGSKGHRGVIKPRSVPMKPSLRDMLKEWCSNRVGLVLGLWDGKPQSFRTLSSNLSSRFRIIFTALVIEDCTEHDIRHTACCLWVELRMKDGRWVFSDVEICRIMGWSDFKMYLRYASLRGEDLASRLRALEA